MYWRPVDNATVDNRTLQTNSRIARFVPLKESRAMDVHQIRTSRAKAAGRLALLLTLFVVVWFNLQGSQDSSIRLIIVVVLLLASIPNLILLIRPRCLILISQDGLRLGATVLAWDTVEKLQVNHNRAGTYLVIIANQPDENGRNTFQVSERLSATRIPQIIRIIRQYHDLEIEVR